MSPRALIAHVIFVVAALSFAWMQANRVEEKKGGPSSTVLLDAKKGDVVKVAYTWPKGTSTVESKGKETGRAVAFNLSRELDAKKPEKKKDDKKDSGPDAGPSDDDAVPVVPQREEARFPGGKTVLTSLEAYEPLKTRRTLGEVEPARLTAMGLDKPERHVVVTTSNGKSVDLEIGESAYGGQGRYARVKGEKIVHLLEPAAVSGFEGGADTLMEKRVVPANLEDIAGYTVRYGDKNAAFTHREREQSAKRRFVSDAPGADDVANEAAGKLMTTLRNLRATKVADAKSAGSAVAGVVVDVVGRDKQKIELLEKTDGEGHLVSSDGWLFEISETQAKELLEDLASVFE